MNISNTNWNLYKSFTVAFETRNLHQAAEILLVSRSAVGQNIKELERQLGVTLFKSDYKGIIPTAEAVNLYSVIKNATTSITNAEHDMQAFTGESAGAIKMVIPYWIAEIFMPFIKEFRAKYPKVKLDFVGSKSSELLTTRDIDLVFDFDFSGLDGGFTIVKVLALTDILAANKDFLQKHGLTQTITKQDLIKLPLILFIDNPESNRFNDLVPETKPLIIGTDSSNMTYSLVKNSMGIGWLSKEHIKAMSDPNIVEVRVKDFDFPSVFNSQVFCAYKSLSRPARAFLDGLLKFINR